MSAWKPLQMPKARPSRWFSRRLTASATAGLRKKEAMNFAEPSGSSPPEKPPGSIKICAWSSSFTSASHALGHVSGGEVLQNQNVRITAGTAEGAGRVVFAVRAGEHRDDDPRRRQAHSGGHTLVGRAVMLAVQVQIHRPCGRGTQARASAPTAPAGGPGRCACPRLPACSLRW